MLGALSHALVSRLNNAESNESSKFRNNVTHYFTNEEC